jgi:hypothetical protein
VTAAIDPDGLNHPDEDRISVQGEMQSVTQRLSMMWGFDQVYMLDLR